MEESGICFLFSTLWHHLAVLAPPALDCSSFNLNIMSPFYVSVLKCEDGNWQIGP